MPTGERYNGARLGRSRRSSNVNNSWLVKERASSLSCVINLMNTIIGSGLLATPHALSQMGIAIGITVILWSGMTAAFGLYLQARCARYLERGTSSFFALSQITYPHAAVFFDAAIAIKCFGVGVSYLIIIGDLMPGVIQGLNENAIVAPFLLDRQFWITAFMLVVIPLSFLRRLDSLKYTSLIALGSIGYLVILVVYHFVKGDTMVDRGEIRVVKWAGLLPTLKSFPVMVFAYTCHQNMFSILNEIGNNSSKSTSSVIGSSIGSAASLYLLVAITGYLSFGNKVTGNIVGMYAPSLASTVGKAAIVVLATFSYPLQVHPCRASVDAVLRWRLKDIVQRRSNESPSRSIPLLSNQIRPSARSDTIGEFRFAFITTVIIILSYVTAMMVSSLDKVLAYVGSTGSTSISFILPGLFYYKISDPDSVHHQQLIKEDDDENRREESNIRDVDSIDSWRKKLLRNLSLALALYGFLVMAICLGVSFFSGNEA
ncbi:hypothetical protein K3495_g7077 [Podosphaera aphanis]|nr:hypothetical protein K3495_g7077 [Podosphaera aphanis]